MRLAALHAWLDSLPPPSQPHSPDHDPKPADSHNHGRAQKRPHGLASPPMSTDRELSPPKRRRHDHDATPRPARSLRLATNPASVSMSSASSASQHTTTSRSSSPRKQLAGLRTIPTSQGGAEVLPLDVDHPEMPADLADLVLSLESHSPLLSLSNRNHIQDHYSHTRGARQWRVPTLYSHDRDALGITPSPDFVDDIVSQARACDEYMMDEAAWSSMVYYPLLRQIFKSPTQSSPPPEATGDSSDAQLAQPVKDVYPIPLDELVVVPCSSASIIPRYRMLAAPFKKVDFAVAYQPRQAAQYDHLRTLVQSTPAPEQSLNHTSYPGLCDRPVVLSIEVKRTNDSGDMARLQLLTWLSAQWNKLDELCLAEPEADVAEQTQSSSPRRRPQYLLALMIQGADWSLVASSRHADGKRVILWDKLRIGDTLTAMGVYKIVQQVQQLASTALVPHAQWFQGLASSGL
ncbi:PD-(D/E)XK nuclease superfamily [Microdochium nivale]|nr:PD-(D/E)XK nuclease superfamily [Microdochium nivale]